MLPEKNVTFLILEIYQCYQKKPPNFEFDNYEKKYLLERQHLNTKLLLEEGTKHPESIV